jgi:hypothetical protein
VRGFRLSKSDQKKGLLFVVADHQFLESLLEPLCDTMAKFTALQVDI